MFAPRRKPWLTGVAVVAVAATAIGVLALRDDAGPSPSSFDPTPSPTLTSASASPSGSPSESPAPTPTVTPAPVSTATPTPTATVSPARTATPGPDATDGRPGWSKAEGSCEQATVPAAGTAPYPDLSVELVLPEGPYRTGTPVNAKLRVTNSGQVTRGFTSYDNSDDGTLAQGGVARSARYLTTLVTTVTWDVQPDVAQEYAITVQAERCGDTSRDHAPALAPGTYQIVASMTWRDASGDHVWSAPAKTITLTA